MKANYYYPTLPVEKLKAERIGLKEMTPEEFEQLKKSIQEVGILTPIHVYSVDEETYQVLEGRHRYRAALELGIKEVPCIVEMSEHPKVRLAHIYDTELIRKDYTPSEKEEYKKQKEHNEKIALERIISTLANQSIPKEVLEKICQSESVNSLAKMEKLIKYVDEYNQKRIADLEKQINTLKQQLDQKDEEKRALEERIRSARKAIKEAGERFQEMLNKKVSERLEIEKEKLVLANKEPSF